MTANNATSGRLTPPSLMDSQAPAQTLRGVRWLILARLAIVVLCLSILLLRSATTDLEAGTLTPLFILLGMGGLSIVYRLLLRKLSQEALPRFVLIQLVLDILAETGLVFFTGGVESNFINLLFVSIVVSSVLLSRRDSALFASCATAGIAIVFTLQWSGIGLSWIDTEYLPRGDQIEALTRLIHLAIAFFVVAYLSGLLAGRLQMEHSLNEEILQNMEEGVAVFDEDGRLAFLNREFSDIFTERRPIQLGDTAADLFPHSLDADIREAIVNRLQIQMELPPCEDPARPRPPLEIRTSLLGNKQNAHGIILIAIDLSLRFQAEQAERRAQRFAALNEMAASLAHEIRNPLTSVRGSLQGIGEDFPEGTPNRRLTEIAIRECDRLDNIITNFLQYARMRTIHTSNMRLHAMLHEVADLLRARDDAKNIKINMDLDGDPWIRCDAEQLREVFLNLGVNAISAMQPGGGSLTFQYPLDHIRPPGTTILRKGDAKMDGVTLLVRDTGPGIPEGMEEKLFEPFYTTKTRGSGLGLAMARRVIEAHGGDIWAKNHAKGGAVFFLWLPLMGPKSKRSTTHLRIQTTNTGDKT